MNNDMKCPICNDGKIIAYLDGTYECDNAECSIYNGTHTETFEALMRTRKALDVAVDALKYANKCIKGGCVNWETEIDKALEQITALEQKDK